ncbi:hypothetical protein ACIBEJ_27920 [Nonomuraea sp. NPDC050790]|uniref:hypothetical protein n=1 Tax=Nonomuraea sp. NPDC050790 TaxID=3364371 RepID=UPI0037AE418C
MVLTEEPPRAAAGRGRSRREPPSYCADGCRCALWESLGEAEPDAPAVRKEHHPDPAVLGYAETCALLGGTQTGLRRLLDAAETMRARRQALIRAHHDADAAVNAYERFVVEGRHAQQVGRACRDERALAARERPAPPTWLRIFRWPAILLIGTFDVWFFQQYFLDVGYTGADEDPGLVQNLIALVPGIAVVFMVLLSATLVGGLVRRRSAGSRVARLLGVVVPVVYLVLVLGLVGYFAFLRAYDSFADEIDRQVAVDDKVILIGALIGLLTLTSILMKVKGDDPEADAVFVARLRRRRSERRCARVQASAKASLARHVEAYSDLRAARDEGLSRFREAMLEAYRRGILEPRAQQRPGAEVPPALTLPPVLHATAVNGAVPAKGAAAREYARLLDDSLVDGAGPLLPEFEDIRQPRPSLGPLPEICRVLARLDPAPLQERWQRVERRLTEDIARLS